MLKNNLITNRQGEAIDYTFYPSSRANVLVILGHGVTGNKDRPLITAIATGLAAEGWPCLALSFSGNGASGGTFENSTIAKETADLQAVLGMVLNEVKIAYIGHSMGAAVGVLTAARDMRISTLISLAGMTHTAAFVAREFGEITPGAGFMWQDAHCPLSPAYVQDLKQIGTTLAAAEALPQPWLLIHGGEDDVVPTQDGRDAYEAATGVKQWLEIPGEAHSFSPQSYPVIVQTVASWLKLHLAEIDERAATDPPMFV